MAFYNVCPIKEGKIWQASRTYHINPSLLPSSTSIPLPLLLPFSTTPFHSNPLYSLLLVFPSHPLPYLTTPYPSVFPSCYLPSHPRLHSHIYIYRPINITMGTSKLWARKPRDGSWRYNGSHQFNNAATCMISRDNESAYVAY